MGDKLAEIQDEEAYNFFKMGKREVLLHDYQSACDFLSKACDRLVHIHKSDVHQELAEPYFYYGQALLCLGLGAQQVLGDGIAKENDDEESTASSDEAENVENGDEKIVNGEQQTAVVATENDDKPTASAATENGDKHTILAATENGDKPAISTVTENDDKPATSTAMENGDKPPLPTTTTTNGDNITDAIPETNDDISKTTTDKGDDKAQQEQQQEEEEEDDEEIPDEGQMNDLQRAFEILECAHMIYTQKLNDSNLQEQPKNQDSIKVRLADIHLMLSEICNENGDFEASLIHAQKAIDLEENLAVRQHRLLAETYYKLGCINELVEKFQDAVDYFDRSIKYIRYAIEDAKQNEQELKELNELLPSVEMKRNDVQSSIGEEHLIKQARAIVSGESQQTTTPGAATGAASIQVQPVAKDITLNIRHKRPAENDGEKEDGNKKLKSDV